MAYSMTKVIFFGTGSVAASSLEFLRHHFDIEAVITKPRAPGHKGSVPVEELATEHRLRTHFTESKKDLDNIIASNAFSSTIGIVVDFGIIISQATISSFKFGIINSHFSLLPEWRGADPITYSILSGQTKTGVSLMVIDAGLDTGKLITYRSLSIASNETTGSLTAKLIDLSNSLLTEFLPRYLSGDVIPKNQPHPDRATYSHKISKIDAEIDWREPAEVIERKIRAYQPWPKARTLLGSDKCIILDAEVIQDNMGLEPGTVAVSKELFIGCGSGSLRIERIQPLGKKEMPVKAFLSGYSLVSHYWEPLPHHLISTK